VAGLPQARLLQPGIPAIQLRNRGPAISRERFQELQLCQSDFAKGYPIPLIKKSCALVVTYQQCADHHFEKTSAPFKRKYFMNFFLSSCAEYHSYFRVSIRRADSTPCHPISKAAALFCGCEVYSVCTRDLSCPVAREIWRAIT
jgi:hypothetical protein